MLSLLQTRGRIAIALCLASLLLLLGIYVCVGASQLMVQWPALSRGLAVIGVVWTLAGPIMVIAAVWTFFTLGRRRMAPFMGGAAAVLAGAVWVSGVLTYVVPCSGPS